MCTDAETVTDFELSSLSDTEIAITLGYVRTFSGGCNIIVSTAVHEVVHSVKTCK